MPTSRIITTQASRFYLAFYAASRSFSSHPAPRALHRFHRSDFSSQGFTGSYDPEETIAGPLAGAPVLGAPKMTPRGLKHHLDQYVVGQERAKKILSVAVYNHYQRFQEKQRKYQEEEELEKQRMRRAMADLHPIEEEFPGQRQAIPLRPPSDHLEQIPSRTRTFRAAIPPPTGRSTIADDSSLSLEKTNILLLGPSGVGKTLMAKTLARVLDVPFSMSDCTPFTQAGYIGEDAEICVSRLLAAAKYDVSATERGIIFLDEIDKISSTKMNMGKDVGGEGVQQSLLKIIEGTTLQIQAKQEHSSSRSSGSSSSSGSPLSGGLTMSPPSRSSSSGSASGISKSETFNVRTDNILFICAGAFNGLQKMIMSRIAKGSIGFGAQLRSGPPLGGMSLSDPKLGANSSFDTAISVRPGSPEHKMFEKHLPYFTHPSPFQDPSSPSQPNQKIIYNPLDLLHPSDLQSFGLIPEFIGRLPLTAALSSLDASALVRVLTEPRNSLIRQYENLFSLSGIGLHFTTPALHAIADSALDMGTGARGLRSVCERLLTETMFEVPGSSVKYVLVNEAVAKREGAPVYFSRGQHARMSEMLEKEEEHWRRKNGNSRESTSEEKERGSDGNFQEYRLRTTASGAG